MPHERVLGVDACKAGWLGIALAAGATRGYFAPRIDELVEQAAVDGSLDVIGIDMPIGQPDRGRRQADVLARAAIGPRRSSVFMTPVRSALAAASHAEAVAINRKLTGEGISIQAYGLRTKLLQVDRWVAETSHRVIEVHPEVSFALIAGSPVLSRKSTWAGVQHRKRLLDEAGIQVAEDLGAVGRHAAVDDVLDAAVAAWSARRFARGEAVSRPDPPETFSDGLVSAIWA